MCRYPGAHAVSWRVVGIISSSKNSKMKSEYIGRLAVVPLGTIKMKVKVQVKIVGVKNVYGRDLYQITPVAGSGEMWVEKITLIADKK